MRLLEQHLNPVLPTPYPLVDWQNVVVAGGAEGGKSCTPLPINIVESVSKCFQVPLNGHDRIRHATGCWPFISRYDRDDSRAGNVANLIVRPVRADKRVTVFAFAAKSALVPTTVVDPLVTATVPPLSQGMEAS